MPTIDTRDREVLEGAVYMVVGRGTEGGAASYHLSITGVTVGRSDPYWGDIGHVQANSGYTLGAIQVDLGQRGTMPVGAISNRPLMPGESTYVDAIIEQSSAYASQNGLAYTGDLKQLRSDLLSHGDGIGKHSSISFIDEGTRDSINAWASSEQGKQWIHRNMDYPQIRNATDIAVSLMDTYGKNIPEEHRFETLCILAKTANQIPGKLDTYKEVLEKGGTYDDVLDQAKAIHAKYGYYGGVKAAELAGTYQAAYADPSIAERLDRANTKVSSETFNPATEAGDEDIAQALRTIGQAARDGRGAHSHNISNDDIKQLQGQLNQLGYTDTRGHALEADGVMGPSTRAAVEAFQRDHGLDPDGVVGPKTSAALIEATEPVASHAQVPLCPTRLDDPTHPDNGFYLRTRDLVYRLDQDHGRTPDHHSDQLASALTVQARADGLQRIDQVALSQDASSLWGAQRPPGARDHFFDQLCNVNTVQGMNTPMEQSGAQWPQAMQQFQERQEQAQAQQQANRQVQEEAAQRSASGMRMQ